MQTLHLVCCGQTDDNVSGRLTGNGDTPINKEGERQILSSSSMLLKFMVQSTCSGFPDMVKIYASEQVRAQQTARILGKSFSKKVITDSALNERGYTPEIQGKTLEEIEEDKRSEVYDMRHFNADMDGVEKWRDLTKRVITFTSSICRDKTTDTSHIIVTHGDIIRAFITHQIAMYTGLSRQLHIDNGSISTIAFPSKSSFQTAEIVRINYVP